MPRQPRGEHAVPARPPAASHRGDVDDDRLVVGGRAFGIEEREDLGLRALGHAAGKEDEVAVVIACRAARGNPAQRAPQRQYRLVESRTAADQICRCPSVNFKARAASSCPTHPVGSVGCEIQNHLPGPFALVQVPTGGG